MIKQRTVKNMKPKAQCKARRLWELMQGCLPDAEFEIARDQCHSMFRKDANFVSGTESYRR